MNIVFDVGNSAIKWGILSVDSHQANDQHATTRVTHVGRCEHENIGALDSLRDSNAHWWVCSVHDGGYQLLSDWFKSHVTNGRWTAMERNHVDIKVELETPTIVGLDRLAAALAVKSSRRIDAPAIFVDFGTATTVNCIDHVGRFIGGAILPGIQTQLNALHHQTDKLPELSWDNSKSSHELIGRSTAHAMLTGIEYSHYFGVAGLLRKMARILSENAGGDSNSNISPALEIYLTGGGYCPTEIETVLEQENLAKPVHREHLVLEGIAAYALKQLDSC